MSLDGFIRSGGIVFSSGGCVLDSKLSSFGEDGERLCAYLARQTGNEFVVSGQALVSALERPENLTDLADFLVAVAFYREEPTFFHVSVDTYHLERHYPRKSEDLARNLAGTMSIDMAKWIPGMSGFDYAWNVELLDAFSRAVGTGFEWPMDEDDFKECVASHAGQFVVGLPEQIRRYSGYRSFTEDDDAKSAIDSMIRRFTA